MATQDELLAQIRDLGARLNKAQAEIEAALKVEREVARPVGVSADALASSLGAAGIREELDGTSAVASVGVLHVVVKP